MARWVPAVPLRTEGARMIRNRWIRRWVAAGLVVGGGLLLWLSPSVPLGVASFVLGVVLELVGLAIERREPR